MWWSWGDAGTSRKWLFGNMERACWSIWDPVWRSDDDEKTQTFRLHEENKENAYLRPYVSKWVSCFLPPLHWCGEPFGPRKMGTAKCLRRPGPHQRQAAHEVPGVPSSGAEDEMRTKRLNKMTQQMWPTGRDGLQSFTPCATVSLTKTVRVLHPNLRVVSLA